MDESLKLWERSLIKISDLSVISMTPIQLSELILGHTWIELDYSVSSPISTLNIDTKMYYHFRIRKIG